MHWLPGLVTMAFGVVTLAGCANLVGPARLRVDYAWAPQNRCSEISPEIRLAGIPAATAALDVSLIDLNAPEINYGGGEVRYQGSPVIPSGALQRFHGPCPTAGPRSYTIRVQAVDELGLILAAGSRTVVCCR